jgi:hypothetical protein
MLQNPPTFAIQNQRARSANVNSSINIRNVRKGGSQPCQSLSPAASGLLRYMT